MKSTSKERVSVQLWWWCMLLVPVLCEVIVADLAEPCRNVIEVNRGAGLDCSATSVHNLVNQTCNDLQDVLMIVSLDEASRSFEECIEVVMHPENYIVTELITIRQNVVLRGIQNVKVTFSLNDTLYPTNTLDPYYVFTFADSDYSGISGIDFYISPGIITFQNVTNVIVEDCSFRYFSQGAVDIYNCHTALVTNCTFEHNGPVSIIKLEQYRGHAGGLSVGYQQDKVLTTRPQLRVEKCSFRNNTCDPQAIVQQSSTQLLQRLAFTGRGGGCSIPINPSLPLNATLEDCLFEENFARTIGGGLYVAFDGQLDHIVVLNRVRLVRNFCPSTAGGLEVGFVSGSTVGSVSSLFAYNTEFIENRAAYGGGLYLFTAGPLTSDGQLSNFAHFNNCTFTGNMAEQFGAAMGFTSFLEFQSVENIRSFEIESCNFTANDGGNGGAVSAANMPLAFRGSNTFEANRGRSFVALATRTEVHGDINFIANYGGGGALYVTSMAQLQLFQGANLTFEGNTGVTGAAVVVDTNLVPEAYSRLLFNPLCFILYENASQFPESWENVSFMFSGNQAVVASAVFMTNLDLCSWLQFDNPLFNPARVFRWEFVHFSDDNKNTAHEPDAYNPEWYIQTPVQSINVTTGTLSAYPGEQFQVEVQAFDELGRPTATILRISEQKNVAQYRFDPAVSTHDRIRDSRLNSSFFSLPGTLTGANEVIVESLLEQEPSQDSFTLVSTSCPPGYVLSTAPLQGNNYTTCECDTQNPIVVDCNGRNIVISEGLWATLDNISQTFITYPCPPQYCQCALGVQGGAITCRFTFDSQNSDNQCTCDREGELCGNCMGGYGVSVLLNKCVTCVNAFGVLIAVLIVLDAVVLTGLMLLMSTYPTWLYPCLFYLQVLPYLTQYFPLTFEKLYPYVYYMSSGLSFYFIYDFCLYHGMSAPVSYLLRYIPLGVALIVCSVVLVIRYVYKKPRDPWYGLWWIVLLMYTHVVHTSMSILNCPILPGRSGDNVARWYVNGNINCFNDGHIPLGLLAIVVLGFCLSIIPVTLTYSVGWLQRPGWLRHTAEVVQKGFKEKYKWWATVELGRRVLLLLFIVAFPGNEYAAIFIISVIISVFGFLQPYKSVYCNILEAILSVDVLVLLLLRNTEQITDLLQVPTQQSSNGTTGRACIEVEGITGFSWLLFPLYYFPLVVFLTATTIWIVLHIRQYILKRCHSITITQPQQEEDVGRIQQAATSTQLDLEELKSEENPKSSDPNNNVNVVALDTSHKTAK